MISYWIIFALTCITGAIWGAEVHTSTTQFILLLVWGGLMYLLGASAARLR
jgi:hypothetical protein